jgi:hypothetical protein
VDQKNSMIRITSAEPLPQYRWNVTFNNGASGVFPVEPERRGGVFLKLAVPVNSDFGCVEWPGGVDLCPEAMHQAMTGLESESELHSAAALLEEPKRDL